MIFIEPNLIYSLISISNLQNSYFALKTYLLIHLVKKTAANMSSWNKRYFFVRNNKGYFDSDEQ